MAIFLNEPRYAWGCFGFYTDRLLGRRIVQVGAIITGLAFIAVFIGGLSPVNSSLGAQAVFLIVSAWVLIFGLMRLFSTGAMWVFTQVFDRMAEGIPSMASAMHYLRRAYWIVIEVFLSTAFLATLIAAVLVGFGVLSLNN
jgi:NADH:ubiquinone oxidoreductase subunit 6 (subunit J)